MTPGLVALAILGPGAAALAGLAAEPGAARLVQALRLLACLAPLFGAALAARFHETRLTLAGLVLFATGLTLGLEPAWLEGPGTPALLVGLALTMGLGCRIEEKGPSARPLVLATTLAMLPALLCATRPDDVVEALQRLGPGPQPSPGLGVSWLGLAAIAVALVSCWTARGRDADVVAPTMSATLGLATLALWMRSPGAGDAAGAVALLGATGTQLTSLVAIAWRRGFVDDLTQLPGRRALDAALDRLSGSYAIAVIDVDHFKRFNDEHGHDAGDDALRIVARVLRSLRGGVAYRQGGEEFVAILKAATLRDAAAALDELREAIESTPLVVRGREGRRRRALQVTASIGVAVRSEANPSPRATLRAADQALLRAKKLGRNRVEMERRHGLHNKAVACTRRASAGAVNQGVLGARY